MTLMDTVPFRGGPLDGFRTATRVNVLGIADRDDRRLIHVYMLADSEFIYIKAFYVMERLIAYADRQEKSPYWSALDKDSQAMLRLLMAAYINPIHT